MRGGLGTLVLLGGLTLGPASGAIPFAATWSVQLEGSSGPVALRLSGEAQTAAGGTLDVTAQPYYPRTFYHSAASFQGYLFIPWGRSGGLAGALGPGGGPGGGFGGRARLRVFSGFHTRSGYSPLCFGVDGLGLPLGRFSTCGTLVTVTGWTTGNVTVTGLGGPDLRAQGYDARTPGGRGNIVLVTPIRIDSPLLPTRVGGIGTLALAFVPEPGTLALTGLGALALAALGRRRALERRN